MRNKDIAKDKKQREKISFVELKDFYQKKIDGLYELAEECNLKVVGSCLLQTGEDIFFAIELTSGEINVLSIYPVGDRHEVFKSNQEICMN